MKNLVLSLGILAATVSICLAGLSALVFETAPGETPSVAQAAISDGGTTAVQDAGVGG